MGWVSQLWQGTYVSAEGAWALIALGAFALLFIVLTARAIAYGPFATRPLAAADRLRSAFARATETGEEVQVALGSGALGTAATPDTLAGLYLVSYLARRAALADVPVRVRVGDATALAGALAALQHGAAATGYPEAFDPAQAEFVAPLPFAYGLGVAEAMRRTPPVANAMAGAWGPEALLPIATGIAQGTPQMGGTSDPAALSLFFGTVEAPLVGEELYAMGAALGEGRHTGSLATQDVFRALIALGVLLGAILALIGRLA
jgi:hypothetical protein